MVITFTTIAKVIGVKTAYIWKLATNNWKNAKGYKMDGVTWVMEEADARNFVKQYGEDKLAILDAHIEKRKNII